MDAKTLGDWYELYGYGVHRRCLHLLGSQVEADDALHEVFLRAQRYGDGLRDEVPMYWLYRIADRHCLNVLRRRQRHLPIEAAQEASTPAVDPRAESLYLVGQVLSACKPRVRSAAILYYVDQLTQEEVAQALQCSRKTVKEKLAQFRLIAAQLLGLRRPGELP